MSEVVDVERGGFGVECMGAWWCESTTILFCIVLYLRCDVLTVHTYYGGYRVVIVPSLPLFSSRVLILSLAAAVALGGSRSSS